MNWKLCAALVCVFATGGFARADSIPANILEVLEKAEQWELMSLEPFTPSEAPKETFRGWEVIGKVTVKDAKDKAKLFEALKEGVKEYKDEDNTRRCFKPRHAVRIKYNDKVLELLICFSCEKIRGYISGAEEENFYVVEKTAGVFNEFLKAAKVPLPKN